MTQTFFGHTTTEANADLDALVTGKQVTMGFIVSTANAGGLNDARAQLAVDDTTAAGAGELVLKRGVYRVASNLTFSSAVRLLYGAIIKPDAGVTVTFNGPFRAGLYKVFDRSAGGFIKFSSTGVVQAILPAWWGYVTDNATECGLPLQYAFDAVDTTYGGRVVLPYGKAYASTSAEIPHSLPDGAVFEVLMIGAQIRTDGPISIIRRYPVNQAEMGTMLGAKVRISGGKFIGDGVTANQKGIQISATYGSVIDQCQFDSLDWGCDLQACLMARVVSCRATNCRTYGFAARLGDWPGAANSIAECNHVRFQSCRNYASAGMTAAFYIFASNGVHVEDCITEGGNAVNNVLFDANSSTTVKHFRLTNLHSENTPTGAIVRIKGSGTTCVIDTIWQQTACVFVDDSGSIATTTVDVQNIPALPSNLNVWKTDGQSGKNWRFKNVNADLHDPTVSTAWVGGVVPLGLHVDRSANAELLERYPAWSGQRTLRHSSLGLNYDRGTLVPLVEETGANDGFDIGLWSNAATHNRWRRFIGMGVATAVRTLTSGAYFVSALIDDLLLADTTGGLVLVELPTAANLPSGSEFSVKHVAGANNVQVQINGAGTIDGAASKVWCAINQAYTFRSDGTNWQALSASSLGSPLGGTGAGGTIPATTTQFLMPGSDIGASATETTRQFVAPRAGTLRNLYVHTTGAQPADAALVFKVRKNGVDTTLTVTVAANAAAGNVSDTTHTAPYVAGDLLSISAANASASPSATIGGFSVVLD